MNNTKLLLRSVGIIILGILFYYTDWTSFVRLVEKIDPTYLLLSAILFPVFILFKIIRWRSLLFIQNISYPMKSACAAYFVSILFGVITPGRVGEISRALYLKHDIGIPITKGLPGIVMDRALDLCVLLLSASLSIVFLPNKITDGLIVPLLAMMVTLIFFLLFIMFGKKTFKTILRLMQRISLFEKSIEKLYSATKKLHLHLMELLCLKLVFPILLTAINISIFLIITLSIAKAVNIPDDFLPIIIPTIVIANIVGLIPITLSGVGTRDAIFVSVFTVIGMNNPIENAILFSLGFLLVFTGFSVLLGSVALLIKPMNVGTIKREANQFFK